MVIENDFWKRAYQGLWGQSAVRETSVADMIRRITGTMVVKSGFGAGLSHYISGSAEDYGHEKGEPDLSVSGTNIKLEVTGPINGMAEYGKPLWIRPDKVYYARKHLNRYDIWIIHCLKTVNMMRVIRLDSTFFDFYRTRKFQLVNPIIRGRRETMLQILHNDPVVKPFSSLIGTIKLQTQSQLRYPVNAFRR